MPEVAAGGGAAPSAPEGEDRYRLFEAVAEVLRDIASASSPWCWCSTTCTGPTPRRC